MCLGLVFIRPQFWGLCRWGWEWDEGKYASIYIYKRDGFCQVIFLIENSRTKVAHTNIFEGRNLHIHAKFQDPNF